MGERALGWTPLPVPAALQAQGRWTERRTSPGLLTPHSCRAPRGSPVCGTQSLSPRERGRGAERGGRRAGGGLAARPHVAGPRGGVGGAEGEGLHPAKFPDGLSLPALSAFPARPARPYGPGRSFPEKNARRAAGPWSRTEPPLGKGRAAAPPRVRSGSGDSGQRPWRPSQPPGTPGRGWTGRPGRGARLGAGWARAGAGGPSEGQDRKSTRLNSSHRIASRMPSSA